MSGLRASRLVQAYELLCWDTLGDGLHELAGAVLGSEMELHRSYAAEWGISTAELENERPTATTRAYTDFLLRVAALAD
jgi:thiaminase